MTSNKFAPVLEGVKHGAVKKAVDLAVEPFSDPLTRGIAEKFQVESEALNSTIEAASRFVVMLGIAQGVEVLGPALGKDDEWVSSMAEYIRVYAGERLGSDGLEAALNFLPDALSGLQSLETSDIKGALQAHSSSNDEKVPSLFDLEGLSETVGEPTDGEGNE